LKIVFFCPPVSVINGGIKHIFRMAEALIEQGRQAVIFEQNGQRPAWFESTAPVVGQGAINLSENCVFVLPEDQPHILSDFSKLPQRKVIYSQNHFYGALGIASAESYADYGVTDILCSSRTIYEHCKIRHPQIRAHVIPCSVDRDIFKPAPVKTDIIAYMPRKRPVEAAYIRDMFKFQHPRFKEWQWREVANVSESQAAKMLGEARVFLSLSRLEGLGLTPLEAMASGCIVAGFTGIGGREYASPENGFWAGEDDFPACIDALARAADLSTHEKETVQNHQHNCDKTLASYTPATFRQSIKEAWNSIV